MSLFRHITAGVRSLLRREQVDHELDEERGADLEMAAAEKMKRGMSRQEVLRAVRLEHGSPRSALNPKSPARTFGPCQHL
jgi:hypothetical protein